MAPLGEGKSDIFHKKRIARIQSCWQAVYGSTPKYQSALFDLIETLQYQRPTNLAPASGRDWLRDAVIYSMPVQSFGPGFDALIGRLDYLKALGVTLLSLTPIMPSPDQDHFHDITDFETVRDDLGDMEAFDRFVIAARAAGFKVMLDMPLGYVSDQHPWFTAAGTDPEKQSYFICDQAQATIDRLPPERRDTTNSSFWAPLPNDPSHSYLHLGKSFEPRLNYSNPVVFIEAVRILASWYMRGVDAFRLLEAHLWWLIGETAEECESQAHDLLALFRAVFDHLCPGACLIADANSAPDLVSLFSGSHARKECHAALAYTSTPYYYAALAKGDAHILIPVLESEESSESTDANQWVRFLRLQEELSLVFVPDELKALICDRHLISDAHLVGDGPCMMGRLYEMNKRSHDRVRLMFSMLFAAGGTPAIYYGDEIGMKDDQAHYQEMLDERGFVDNRYLHRGQMGWRRADKAERAPFSAAGWILRTVRYFIKWRRHFSDCFQGKRTLYRAEDKAIFAVSWSTASRQLLIIHNLSDQSRELHLNGCLERLDNGSQVIDEAILLEPLEQVWLTSGEDGFD